MSKVKTLYSIAKSYKDKMAMQAWAARKGFHYNEAMQMSESELRRRIERPTSRDAQDAQQACLMLLVSGQLPELRGNHNSTLD